MLIEDLYTQSFAHEKEEKLLLLSKKALRKQSPIKDEYKKANKTKIAEQIYNEKNNKHKKLPIDFHTYQIKADNFKTICPEAGLPSFDHKI